MLAPDSIKRLVDNFEQNKSAFLSPHYKEAQLRQDFLDPFFEALGWQLKSIESVADAFRDVVIENAVRVEGSFKAPDYAFRVGPVSKFFVEAKKPSINLEKDSTSAFQVRSYAWSAKLPVSILSDFEEFAVYDCRNRPDRSDSAATDRIKLLNYKDYLTRWDEIEDVFSRKAVWAGKLDEWITNSKGKKGTLEVDDAFLQEIEKWRDLLARNIAIRNPGLSTRELNYAVQMTIDRIIFLRICEDRQIESEDRLKDICSGEGIYPEMVNLFRKADARYNSGLFHFTTEKSQSSSPDDLTPTLSIDDKVLKDIVSSLYYPSPYVFRVLPVEILGQVYERFLGKVIRLTAGHQAKVEEKPEVRKAGGMYYTPTYIVDYIVKNTVGKLLENKTPAQAASLKIVDPACGSGSFLLGAYQYLLDWHIKWYSDNQPEKWCKGKSPAIYQAEGGWRLTTAEKKKILINNIHGVDIDPQAVEVTKLSLSLKVLEGESQETINSQLSLFKERALPDLAKNIQCGNSLIGSDYNEGKLFEDEEERLRVNPFDWKVAFQQVFAQGGFDAVIGNPPYVRQEGLVDDKYYFQTHYKTYLSTADLYIYFIEKAFELIKTNGLFGMIISNKWLRTAYGEPLRKFLSEEKTLFLLIDLAGLPVFEGATVRTVILVGSNGSNAKTIFRYLAPLKKDDFNSIRSGSDLENLALRNSISLPQSALKSSGWFFTGVVSNTLLDKIQSDSLPITNYLNEKLYYGIKTGFNEAFIINKAEREKLITADPKSAEVIKPILSGRDIRRYNLAFAEKYLIWTYIGIPIKNYPAIFEHLSRYKEQLQARWDKGNYWWELRACDYYNKFSKAKIIYPDISITCRFCVDEQGYFGANTTYIIPVNDLYLLGLLNSKFAQYYFSQMCAGLEGQGTIYLRFIRQYVERFPVHIIKSELENQCREGIIFLVKKMMNLQKRNARVPQEKEALQREIVATDKQIDNLVYQLYGLTPEEIKIVEGAK
jgi:hypothetical protein